MEPGPLFRFCSQSSKGSHVQHNVISVHGVEERHIRQETTVRKLTVVVLAHNDIFAFQFFIGKLDDIGSLWI